MDSKAMPIISQKNIYLRTLRPQDVGERYLRWVTDPEVTAYLEIKYNKYTLEDLCRYVKSFENDNTKYIFGIYTKVGDEHIGNATIYNINYNVKTFDFGYLIGEKKYWGGNISIEIVLALLKYAFETLDLRKYFGGVYAGHIRSRFVMKRLGFVEEACLKERFLFEGKPVDEIIYTMDRKQWELAKRKFNV